MGSTPHLSAQEAHYHHRVAPYSTHDGMHYGHAYIDGRQAMPYVDRAGHRMQQQWQSVEPTFASAEMVNGGAGSGGEADEVDASLGMTSHESGASPRPKNERRRQSSGQAVHLKKQQACLTCKRRKTRCDAVRPVCGACSRSQARAARGHGLTAEVPPGPCTYPDNDAGPSEPTAKSHSPTSNNASMGPPAKKQRLLQQSGSNACHESGLSSPGSSGGTNQSTASGVAASSFESPSSDLAASSGSPDQAHKVFIDLHPTAGGAPARVRRFYGGHPGMNLRNLINPPMSTGNVTATAVANSIDAAAMDSAEAVAGVDATNSPQVDLLLRQMWPEISPDLPTPSTIRHMAELFFSKHPCRHMFCRETMMARLRLPPSHHLRPHPSLIHAILAAAEPFSPLVPKMRETDVGSAGIVPPNGSGSGPGAGPSIEELEAVGRGFVGIANSFESPRPNLQANLSFGEFHLAKARREVEAALLTSNQRPLEWLQAGILASYCLLERCRIMEMFFIAAALVRSLAPTGIDKMPNSGRDVLPARSVFEAPESSIVEYEQRQCLWQAYLIDVYGAGPPKFFEPCLADEKEQVTTTLPKLMGSVEDDTKLLLSEQTLRSEDLFRADHSDTFNLHVKSACLLKRARLMTSRKGHLLERMPSPPEDAKVINDHISQLMDTFPRRQGIDSDWVVAEANMCVARFTLHQHFVGAGLDANSTWGRGPIERAAEKMLETVHFLLASSYDLSLLHAQTFICWLVLVRVLEVKARLLKRLWQSGSAAQVQVSIDSVMQALAGAAEKSLRAKTSLQICRAAAEQDLSDDEFADLVYLWQAIPTAGS